MPFREEEGVPLLKRSVTVRGLLGASLLVLVLSFLPGLVTTIVTSKTINEGNDKADLSNCDAGNTSRAGIRALSQQDQNQQDTDAAQAILKAIFPDPRTRETAKLYIESHAAAKRRVQLALFPMKDCPKTVATHTQVYVDESLARHF